jgi:hypothetical protein
MDQATLVNLDINAGLKVIDTLDAEKLRVAVALWMLSPDYSDWRLVLASSTFDQSHPLRAYEQAAEALHGRFAHMRPPILILPIRDPFIRELRRIFGKASDVTGMRLRGQTIGDRYISDAYVYRIQ